MRAAKDVIPAGGSNLDHAASMRQGVATRPDRAARWTTICDDGTGGQRRQKQMTKSLANPELHGREL
jgi:hypothetical protein